MILRDTKLFTIAIGVTAMFIASTAATFSILGIGMLFSGASTSAMVMATALELGKVISVSFLYRYWGRISTLLKTYLIASSAALVVITSLGIFGWLSAAYQASAIKYDVVQQQVIVLEEQKNTHQTQLSLSTQRANSLASTRTEQEKRLGEALNNQALLRNPSQMRLVQEQSVAMIKATELTQSSIQKDYDLIVAKIADIDRQITDIRLESIKSKDVITFKFVADAFGVDMNVVVKWFITVIITVFDPLAICLILAYNVAMLKPSIMRPEVVGTVAPVVDPDLKKN